MSLVYGDKRRPIGVFDSGLGGLSILSEIHRLLPTENLIYLGDSANAPYGDQNANFVRKRSLNIADYLINQGVKALVIACNTATVESITVIRENVNIPVVGIEPAIKPASKVSINGVIGVLATQRTIDSERLLILTERYAKEAKIITQACPGLVEQVEACELTSETTFSLLRKYIQPLLNQGADTLILGCTHYPFLIQAIRHIVGEDIQIIETANPVALQLRRILKGRQLEHSLINNTDPNQLDSSPVITFYNTDLTPEISKVMQQLWKMKSPFVQLTKMITERSPAIIKPIEVLPLPALN